jgi:hypothetical protein
MIRDLPDWIDKLEPVYEGPSLIMQAFLRLPKETQDRIMSGYLLTPPEMGPRIGDTYSSDSGGDWVYTVEGWEPVGE